MAQGNGHKPGRFATAGEADGLTLSKAKDDSEARFLLRRESTADLRRREALQKEAALLKSSACVCLHVPRRRAAVSVSTRSV